MGSGTEIDQTRTVNLDRGLFLIQYQSADDSTAPPHVWVAAAAGSEKKVDFVLHPDATEPTLWQPKSALVIRVSSAARVNVRVEPSRPGGSRAATIRIEPIESGQQPRTEIGDAQHVDVLNLEDMRILGHIAGIGDVVAGRNAWIAGPSAPSRIEGFALEWPSKPVDIDIRYAAKIAGAHNAVANVIPLGAFAGTRGRALPIVGLVMEMVGRSDLEFIVEALFLNSPILTTSGRRIAITGPTGQEPMVGLRISLQAGPKPLLTSPSPPNAQQAEPSASRKSGKSSRVRVFRSRAGRDASFK